MNPAGLGRLIGVTYLLIPGAGGVAWYWHRVVPLLDADANAVDLPGADPAQGLPEYTDRIVAAARGEVVLVAQSLGAFSALPAVERLHVRRVVLLNAMIPAPGETPGQWWETTGWSAQRTTPIDPEHDFLHDVPADVIAYGEGHQRPEADIAFTQPCAIERWPDVPTTVLAGREDRFFTLAFQRRIARERLGLDVQELPGGHLAALSQPEAVAAALRA
jgi:pimeloyl-ACP methyl ester carboxylesterase